MKQGCASFLGRRTQAGRIPGSALRCRAAGKRTGERTHHALRRVEVWPRGAGGVKSVQRERRGREQRRPRKRQRRGRRHRRRQRQRRRRQERRWRRRQWREARRRLCALRTTLKVLLIYCGETEGAVTMAGPQESLVQTISRTNLHGRAAACKKCSEGYRLSTPCAAHRAPAAGTSTGL